MDGPCAAVHNTGSARSGLFFCSSRRRHTRCYRDWSSDVCSSNDQLPKYNFVTDGARLYVAETLAGHGVLSQVSTEGGETSQIPTPFPNIQVFDIAPNHSELLVGSFVTGTQTELPVWLLPIPSGSPLRLGDVNAHDGAWLPDR